jgi:hypothetical protein
MPLESVSNDELIAELSRRLTVPEPQRNDDQQEKIDTLAWLHAELIHQLTGYVELQQEQTRTVAWLHTELVHQLKEILAQQQALVARAKAVRLAKTNTAKTNGIIQ